MDALTTVLIIIGGIAILGLIVYWILLIFRDEDEQLQDNLIINFMSNYTTPVKGHAIGLEVNTKRIGKRFLIEYAPRDINKKLLKDKDKIDNVKVAVDSNKILVLPEGTLSGYRSVKILLPPTAEDFADNLKTTQFGQAMMELTEKINDANVEAKIIRTGSNRKTKLLNDIGDGEISEEWVERTKDYQKELDKMKDSSKGTPTSSGFSPPRLTPP